jgi:hypothetical protein
MKFRAAAKPLLSQRYKIADVEDMGFPPHEKNENGVFRFDRDARQPRKGHMSTPPRTPNAREAVSGREGEAERTRKPMRQYPPKLLARILFVLLLSFLDAFFTLYLLHMGAVETNPVMAFFLEFGPAVFMVAKYGITVICVAVMLIGPIHMGEKGEKLADRLFYFLAGAFEIVILWELYMIFFGFG